MSGLLTRLRVRLLQAPAPDVAVELHPRSLGVLRVARRGGAATLAAAALVDLPEGVVAPSLLQPNVTDAAALVRALRAAMERAGVAPGSPAALLLPDPAARLAVFPAEEIVSRTRDADEVLRFRLRKGVPFEIREAALAFEAWPASPGRPARALAAAMAREVLLSYEAPVREAGLEPGHVEPASLALLRAAGSGPGGDDLLVNWDDGYVSFLLTQDGVPALVRTLQAAGAEDVAREAASTLLYHRERLEGGALRRALLRPAAAAADAGALAAALETATTPIDAWAGLQGAVPGPAAIPLAAAAAALGGKAA
ncbi:MAG: hypothetical protein AB7O37_22640 [Vicinamibacteria bacterium]